MIIKKLTKSPLAFSGILLIGLFLVIALLGANIRPDQSKDANQMSINLSNRKPGFSSWVLINGEVRAQKNYFQKLFFGGEQLKQSRTALQSYHIKGDTLYYFELGEDTLFDSRHRVAISSLGGQDNSPGDTGDLLQEHLVYQTFWLGTDKFGRDYLSRLMAGAVVSLSVGIIAVIVSLLLGVFLGAVAGFYRGKIDDWIVWFTNVVWSVPTLLMVMAITLVLGKGFWQIFIAVGLTMWVEVCRVTRGQIMSLREKEFAAAAKVLGFSDMRILLRHLLPNTLGPLIVVSASNFATAILIEAGLSFLGLGAQPPMPSWGSMIKENYGYIILGKPYLAVFPGLAISLLVFSFVVLGNGIRDAFDVRREQG